MLTLDRSFAHFEFLIDQCLVFFQIGFSIVYILIADNESFSFLDYLIFAMTTGGSCRLFLD